LKAGGENKKVIEILKMAI